MDSSRTEIILGKEGVTRLREATVAVFGLGGVGGHAAECLARAGVGKIILNDHDIVSPSDLNRQAIAFHDNIGLEKTEACAQRLLRINPELKIEKHPFRLTEDNISQIIKPGSDNIFAVDAIDDIDAKVALIAYLKDNGNIFISSMGAGNRVETSSIAIEDISKTSHCPLARIVRKRLREREIKTGIKVVFSKETPLNIAQQNSQRIIGSTPWLPGIFGLTAASYIIRKIARGKNLP